MATLARISQSAFSPAEDFRAKGGLDKSFAKVYDYTIVAKYDALRKLERNQMLQEYAAAHPELSLKEIGRIFNISESRVWRILKRNTGRDKSAKLNITQS